MYISKQKIQKMVLLALFSAVSVVLFYIEFPLIPSLSYLKMDFSDIPALIAGITLGPIAGVIVELIKNLINFLTIGISSQLGFGNLMNFIIGCSYVVPFSIIFRAITKKQADNLFEDNHKNYIKKIIPAALISTICMVVIGFGGNYIIAPLFFKHFLHQELSSEFLMTTIYATSLFNAVKSIVLGIVSYIMLYALRKPLDKILPMQINTISKQKA